jgi:hypothetical protein
MKKFQCNLFLLSFIIFLPSCCGLFFCRKQFNIFKEPIITNKSNYTIKTDGIYVSQNSSGSMAFYTNGIMKTIASNYPEGKDFWKNPETGFADLKAFWNYNSKETWGNYTINGDSIKMQNFGWNGMEFCSRSVYEMVGKILNDSTIILYSDYSFWFKYDLINKPNIFGFYLTNKKPDSSKAWFNNRRWYKKNIHESRKVKK